jgi:hypothetical protein
VCAAQLGEDLTDSIFTGQQMLQVTSSLHTFGRSPPMPTQSVAFPTFLARCSRCSLRLNTHHKRLH